MRTFVYGSRPDGHAKVVIDLAGDDANLELAALVDDHPENAGRTIRGLKVVGSGTDLETLGPAGEPRALLLGFGESRGRAGIVERAHAAGYELPILVHESAEIRGSAQLEMGVQVLARAYVGPDAHLSAGVLVNTGAIVEHDAFLASGSVVGPAAVICGRARIGREALVGAAATILPDVVVGVGAVVGAGAVVREDVPDATVVAGVPARTIRKRQ